MPLFDMLLGEVVFGGLGTGLYSIILVALIALFLAGLVTVLLVGTILIVGGLSYFPALALGPVVEHLIMSG